MSSNNAISSLRARLKRCRSELTDYLNRAFYSHCMTILSTAMQMDSKKIFYDNPSHLTEYTSIVRRPMYWKLVERNLATYSYSSSQQFVSDMRLVFDNCYKFNTRNAEVSEVARTIEIEVEKLFVTVLGEPPSSVKDIVAAGRTLSEAQTREIWDTACFYEKIPSTSSLTVKLDPKRYSAACQRRILEIIRRGDCKKEKGAERHSLPHKPKPRPVRQVCNPAPEVDTAPLILDAVPQNSRSDYVVRQLSPVCSDISGEDSVDFANA